MTRLLPCIECHQPPQMHGSNDKDGAYLVTCLCINPLCDKEGQGVMFSKLKVRPEVPLTEYTDQCKRLWNDKQQRGDTNEC